MNTLTLDVYQKYLSAMEWAFEIFIRIKSKQKSDFFVNYLPFGDTPEKNTLYILSKILPNFVIEDALKFIEGNQEQITQKRRDSVNASACPQRAPVDKLILVKSFT